MGNTCVGRSRCGGGVNRRACDQRRLRITANEAGDSRRWELRKVDGGAVGQRKDRTCHDERGSAHRQRLRYRRRGRVGVVAFLHRGDDDLASALNVGCGPGDAAGAALDNIAHRKTGARSCLQGDAAGRSIEFGWFNIRNRTSTKKWKDITLKAAQNATSVCRIPGPRILGEPFASDLLKGILGPFRARQLADLTLLRRIDPFHEKLTSLITAISGFLLARPWVDAKQEALLLAGEAVLQPPPPAACSGHFKIYAAPIEELHGFTRLSFEGSYLNVCKGHVGPRSEWGQHLFRKTTVAPNVAPTCARLSTNAQGPPRKRFH
jgi:hypothetical protein